MRYSYLMHYMVHGPSAWMSVEQFMDTDIYSFFIFRILDKEDLHLTVTIFFKSLLYYL